MTELRLALLGPLRLTIHRQPLAVLSQSSIALLGYLALTSIHGRIASRTAIANSLWPEVSEVRARRNLTETIYRLRQTTEDGAYWLHVDHHILALHGVALDIVEFRALVDSPRLDDGCAALDLYSGDLIENLDADWIIEDRIWFRDQYLVTLERVCKAVAQAARYSEALVYAHRWVLVDPLNENAHRAVMQLNARLGRHAAALQQYDELVRHLEEELCISPLPETRALANMIRAECYATEDPCPPPRPLIGRRYERSALLHHVERAQDGEGGVVLVEGEPGIGKTYLLEAIAEGALWRGMMVTWGKVEGYSVPDPYAPLTTMLTQMLYGPCIEQLRRRLPESTVRTLSALIPSLMHEAGSTSTATSTCSIGSKEAPHFLPELADEIYVSSALANALTALAEMKPWLVILDDVQWARVQFWRAIQACMPLLSGQRLLLVLSYRDNELRSQADAWRVLRALDRDYMLPRLRLKQLSSDDCRALARELGASDERVDTLDLYHRTAGNPLLVRELLATPDGLPLVGLHQLFNHRLARLTPAARSALEVAAVLGHQFSYAQWFALVGSTLVGAVSLLLTEHCIEETNHSYHFVHDLFREHIYQLIPPQRCQTLHRRTAEALRHSEIPPERLGWHYMRAGALLEAARCYREAGEYAEREAAYDTAVTYYQCAIEQLAQLPEAAAECQALAVRQHAIGASQQHTTSGAPAIQTMTYLARIGAPLGKKLSDAERVQVRWTIDAGEADMTVLLDAGKVALRRHRIARLVDEAHTQGAIPTEKDLAHALHVTERTIVADLAAMRASGAYLLTRRYQGFVNECGSSATDVPPSSSKTLIVS